MIKSVISIDGFPQGSRFMRKRSWLLWLCPPCRVVEEAKRSPVGLVVPLKVSQDHHVDTLQHNRVLENVQWKEEEKNRRQKVYCKIQTILIMIIMKNIIIAMMIISMIKRIPPHPEGYCRHQPWSNVRPDDHST